jgi:hypothetical protein
MAYYNTPHYSVAINAKVGTSSMARAILREFQPEQGAQLQRAHFPRGKTVDDFLWHRKVNITRTATKPVVLLVRDPVLRFVSAMQQVGLKNADVAQAIQSLVNDTPVEFNRPERVVTSARVAASLERQRANREAQIAAGLAPRRRPNHLRDNFHFLHQHLYAAGPTICFRFPDHIADAAAMIGLTRPMPKANEAKREKPTLTNAQAAAVRAYYAADQALFDAIIEPGYVYAP